MFAKFYYFWKCISTLINSMSFSIRFKIWTTLHYQFFQMSWFSCMLLILSNKNFVQKDFEIGFYLLVENIYFQYKKMELGASLWFSKKWPGTYVWSESWSSSSSCSSKWRHGHLHAMPMPKPFEAKASSSHLNHPLVLYLPPLSPSPLFIFSPNPKP